MPEAGLISVIAPVFNEEDNIAPLYAEVAAALAGLDQLWEFVLVDDGSVDRSLERIKALAEQDARVRFLSFAANAGQSSALQAGFAQARGDIFVTLDADLQNVPADIPVLLAIYAEGYDLVNGRRADRQDKLGKRLASRLGNAVRRLFTRDGMQDTGCSLKVLRGEVARKIPMFKGMHRFLPALVLMQGGKVKEVPVRHRSRQHGSSKYRTWGRAWKAFFDLFAVRWMQKRYVCPTIKESSPPANSSTLDAK